MSNVFNFLLNCSSLFVVCETSCVQEIQVVVIDTEEPCHPTRAVSALRATRSPWFADRRLHRSLCEETPRQSSLEVSWVRADQAILIEEADLELGSETNCGPMNLVLNVGHDMRVLRYPQDDPHRCARGGWMMVKL